MFFAVEVGIVPKVVVHVKFFAVVGVELESILNFVKRSPVVDERRTALSSVGVWLLTVFVNSQSGDKRS